MAEAYLKLAADYVDQATQTPLPEGVLEVADYYLSLSSNSDGLRVGVWSSEDAYADPQAAPMSLGSTALSTAEVAWLQPRMVAILLTMLSRRPEFAGSVVVLPPGESVFASSATVALDASTNVKKGATVSLPQLSATLVGSGLVFSGGRLSVAIAGEYQLTGSFSLATGTAAGGGGEGVLLINDALEVASAVLVDDNGVAAANVSVLVTVPLGATIDLAYRNTSSNQQNVLAGGSLAAQAVQS